MKRRKLEDQMTDAVDMANSSEESVADDQAARAWEIFAHQTDREAQQYYEALARAIQTADEGLRDKRTSPTGRAYLARIAKEAKKALGKEFGLALREDDEIRIPLTNRSLN